jgi:acetyl esterase/lipase
MISSIRLVAVAVAGIFLSLLPSQTAQAQTVVRDLAYGPEVRNQLDLFLPEQAEGAPLVLYIHGGRWLRGDKSQVEDYGRVEAMNRAGIAVASMNHTYSTEAPWPAQLEDALAAISWLEVNAETYGFDASRMGLWGQSSGGHLVLMTAAALASDPKGTVKAVVAWFPPSDLNSLVRDRLDDDVPDRGDGGEEPLPESLLIGAPVAENPAAADDASPVAAVSNLSASDTLPPVLLVHGTDDFIVSPLQTQRLFQVLSAREGQQVSLRWVEGGTHGGSGFDAETDPSVDFLARFLETVDETD